MTSNRPIGDWGKLLGDAAALTAMLDRLLHHGHVLKCGPRSWRTKVGANEHGLTDLTSAGSWPMSAFQSKAKRSRAKPARRLRVLGSRASALRLHQKNLHPSETLRLDKPTRLTRRGFRDANFFGANQIAQLSSMANALPVTDD